MADLTGLPANLGEGPPARAEGGPGATSGALGLWRSYPFRCLSKNAVQRFQASAAAAAL